ncbi:hypothetical protein F5Y08DRAFT_310879 [Xylaria arbuscula]|nr:hypothetical protein F5Y08DRAFT_310879 [Xylaria arbuscula]
MSSLEEPRAVRWLELRDPTIPSVCYDVCNNAILVAQSVGKTPELCSAYSEFMVYYGACSDCVHSRTTDTESINYLDESFSEFLDYCDAIVNPTTVTGLPPATPLVAETLLVTISVTTTIDGSRTVWPSTETLTSYVPLPDTTIVSVTTSENGHRTIWTFVKTLTPLSSGFFEHISPTTSSITTQQHQSRLNRH